MAQFDEQIDARFEEDLQRARGYKPVTRRELRKAYDQYNKVGLKFGQVKKSESDEDLYAKATNIVLKWWKYQQQEKVERKQKLAEAKRNAQADPLRGAESNYTGGRGWGGSGGGGGYGGEMLPDTAMGDGEAGHRFLNPKEERQILRQMGVPMSWKPPMQATQSPEALQQWVEETAARRDFNLARKGQGYFDTSVVRRIARRYGVSGINFKNVPRRHRNTIAEIRRYVLRIKKLQRLNEMDSRNSDSTRRRRTSAPDTVERRGGFRPGL